MQRDMQARPERAHRGFEHVFLQHQPFKLHAKLRGTGEERWCSESVERIARAGAQEQGKGAGRTLSLRFWIIVASHIRSYGILRAYSQIPTFMWKFQKSFMELCSDLQEGKDKQFFEKVPLQAFGA